LGLGASRQEPSRWTTQFSQPPPQPQPRLTRRDGTWLHL